MRSNKIGARLFWVDATGESPLGERDIVVDLRQQVVAAAFGLRVRWAGIVLHAHRLPFPNRCRLLDGHRFLVSDGSAP